MFKKIDNDKEKDEEVQQALLNAHFLRNRFTICKLGRILNLVKGM